MYGVPQSLGPAVVGLGLQPLITKRDCRESSSSRYLRDLHAPLMASRVWPGVTSKNVWLMYLTLDCRSVSSVLARIMSSSWSQRAFLRGCGTFSRWYCSGCVLRRCCARPHLPRNTGEHSEQESTSASTAAGSSRK